MRAVLDPNVIISALLSPEGPPARVLREWLLGGFELVVSPLLLEELERALAYRKLRKRIHAEEAADVLELLRSTAIVAPDPEEPPPVRSPDPGDDYLVGLAASTDALVVSGDDHLLGLAAEIPVTSPANFVEMLHETGNS